MFRTGYGAAFGLALLLTAGDGAEAQPFEQAGARALGLGGAFVGLADDATAVWWNPAGLANGPFFNVVLERQSRRREPPQALDALERSAVDQTLSGFALATPPLGLSYFRTRYTIVPAAGNRNGRQTKGVGVASLVAHHTGITLLHSITSTFVVGSTVKFVRGIAALDLSCPVTGSECQGGAEDALDRGADLIGRATNRLDADFGIQWLSGPLRAGLTVRNLAEPRFRTPDGQEITVERQVRGGLALTAGQRTTVAADVDLTEEQEDPAGRRISVGLEQRVLPRLAVRSGIRVTTGNRVEGVPSFGASVAVRSGLWVDGFWSGGRYDEVRWGIAARAAY